jgi:hypothetical protein
MIPYKYWFPVDSYENNTFICYHAMLGVSKYTNGQDKLELIEVDTGEVLYELTTEDDFFLSYKAEDVFVIKNIKKVINSIITFYRGEEIGAVSYKNESYLIFKMRHDRLYLL